jgi:hypothetical protein
VRPLTGGWTVQHNGQAVGMFGARAEAVRAAVMAAEASGRSGAAARVLSQDETGDVHTVWQSGRDRLFDA